MKIKPIKADELVQRVLRIIDREIKKIEESDEDLSDTKLRMLPQFLRIVLASKSDQKKDTAEEENIIQGMTTEELIREYQKEKEKA